MDSPDSPEEIFEQASNIEDPDERSRFLDEVCPSGSEIRARIDSMLSSPTLGDGFFFEDADVPAEQPGHVIGRYELLSLLGEGGFGSVWLAQQSEPVKREVALKIIKLGMDTRQVVTRFEQERQALAMMEHPHIARVLDAGATSAGRPYFVMDRVRGEPVVNWCHRTKPAIRTCLEIILQAGAALRHAHSRGIIHRDIKSSNILVGDHDQGPHATVIDFGIAKATHGKVTEQTLMTAANQIIGTLAYMSPEQASGSQDIDTRADVYSLGAVLYEILAGSPPFNPRAHPNELQRQVCEVDPALPSTLLRQSGSEKGKGAGESRRRYEAVRGELDWIVMRALEKDRTRRYSSIDAFIRDIERFLAGEPVEAAPPSRTYRARKFVKRHRVLVASLTAVLAALLLGIVGAVWGKVEADDARLEAEQAAKMEARERRQAEAVAGIFEGIMRGINPDLEVGSGPDASSSDAFKTQIIANIDEAIEGLSEFADDFSTTMRIQVSLGQALIGLAEYVKAEKLFRSAWESRRARFGPDHSAVAEAAIHLGTALQHLGRHNEALKCLDEVSRTLKLGEKIAGFNRLEIDHMRAMVLSASGRSAEAIALLEDIERRALAEPENDEAFLLFVRHNLGAACRNAQEFDRAIEILEGVYDGRIRLLGEGHADTLMTANSLFVSYSVKGRLKDAIRVGWPLLEETQKRYGPDHHKALVAVANLANSVEKDGRPEEALTLMSEAAGRALERYGAGAYSTAKLVLGSANLEMTLGRRKSASLRASSLFRPRVEARGCDDEAVEGLTQILVATQNEFNKPGGAAGWFADLLEQEEAKGKADSEASLRWRAALATGLLQSGDSTLARRVYEETAAAMERHLGAESVDTLGIKYRLGCLDFAERRAQEAIKIFEEILPLQEKTLGEGHKSVLATMVSLGASYWLAGDLNRSIPMLEASVEACESVLGLRARETIHAMSNLAVNLLTAKRPADLIKVLKPRWPAMMESKSVSRSKLVELANNLAVASSQTSRLRDGLPAFKFLAEESAKKLGQENSRTRSWCFYLARSYSDAEKPEEAAAAFRQLWEESRKTAPSSSDTPLRFAEWLSIELREFGKPEEALKVLQEAGKARWGGSGLPPIENFQAVRHYVEALIAAARADEAATIAEKALVSCKKSEKTTPTLVAEATIMLAQARLAQGKAEEAEALARANWERLAEDKRMRTGAVLGAALMALGRDDEAETILLECQKRIAEMPNRMANTRLTRRLVLKSLAEIYETRANSNSSAELRAKAEHWRKAHDALPGSKSTDPDQD